MSGKIKKIILIILGGIFSDVFHSYDVHVHAP